MNISDILEHHKGRPRRNPNMTNDVDLVGSPPIAPSNVAVENGPYSHIRVVPSPLVEAGPDQSMQGTDSFYVPEALENHFHSDILTSSRSSILLQRKRLDRMKDRLFTPDQEF